MADEEVKEVAAEEVAEDQPKQDPEVSKEDIQAVMAKIDELAKDLAALKAKQEEMEDEEDYEEIAY